MSLQGLLVVILENHPDYCDWTQAIPHMKAEVLSIHLQKTFTDTACIGKDRKEYLRHPSQHQPLTCYDQTIQPLLREQELAIFT